MKRIDVINDNDELDLRFELSRYLGILQRGIWLLLVLTVCGAVVALIISETMQPIYQARTTIMVIEGSATKSLDYSTVLANERLAQSYAKMITSQPVLEKVKERLNLQISSIENFRNIVKVELLPNTQLIEIKVEDNDATLAAEIANAIYEEFYSQLRHIQSARFETSRNNIETQILALDNQIQKMVSEMEKYKNNNEKITEQIQLESTLAQYRQAYASLVQSLEQVRLAEVNSSTSVIQIERAFPPNKPIRPNTFRNIFLGGAIGLVLGIFYLVLSEALDDRIKGVDDISRYLDLPILSVIMSDPDQEEKVVTVAEPRSPISEAFRTLRTNLLFASVDKPLRTIVVTSPTPGEGKSTVSINLGVVLAQGGKKVAVVDADLRRPTIHKRLNQLNFERGLSTIFVADKLEINEFLQSTEVENLFVLTAGKTPPNPSELLASEKMNGILLEIKEFVDIIILDSSPILAVSDSLILSNRVDGVILVIQPGLTKIVDAQQSVEQLRRVGAHILGIALNNVPMSNFRYGYNYYSSYHYYSDDGANSSRKPIWKRSIKDKPIRK